MSYISFKQIGVSPSGKTRVWEVSTADGSVRLGAISWYGPFRKYAFLSFSPSNVYDPGCLREIASFAESQTNAHNTGRHAE